MQEEKNIEQAEVKKEVEVKPAEVEKEAEVKPAKSTKDKKVEPKKEPNTVGYMVSKANYVIQFHQGNQVKFIQPFGRTKVVRELCKFDPADTKFLTFIKL